MYLRVNNFIKVPDGLISSQFREDGIKVSPKTLYLYVWTRILLTDFESQTLQIQPITLRQKLGWKTNLMLKNHLKVLKDLGYISYQDEFDDNTMKANQMLNIHIKKIEENFKQLTELSITEKIFGKVIQPEKALKLCYLIKAYTNNEYGYCWLTFEQIVMWGSIRKGDISAVCEQLMELKLIHITRGGRTTDEYGRAVKQSSKYQLTLK